MKATVLEMHQIGQTTSGCRPTRVALTARELRAPDRAGYYAMNREVVRQVGRGTFAVYETLCYQRQPMTHDQLADETGLPHTTIERALEHLAQLGAVDLDASLLRSAK